MGRSLSPRKCNSFCIILILSFSAFHYFVCLAQARASRPARAATDLVFVPCHSDPEMKKHKRNKCFSQLLRYLACPARPARPALALANAIHFLPFPFFFHLRRNDLTGPPARSVRLSPTSAFHFHFFIYSIDGMSAFYNFRTSHFYRLYSLCNWIN